MPVRSRSHIDLSLKVLAAYPVLLKEEILVTAEFSLLLCIVYLNNMVGFIVCFYLRNILCTWKQAPENEEMVTTYRWWGVEVLGAKSDEGINPAWPQTYLLGCNKQEGELEDDENEET